MKNKPSIYTIKYLYENKKQENSQNTYESYNF